MSNMARPQVTADELANATWRKSSFSNDQGQCVGTAALSNGGIAVRNSNYPDAGAVVFTRAEMSAWINGCKAGEFDDLAQT